MRVCMCLWGYTCTSSSNASPGISEKPAQLTMPLPDIRHMGLLRATMALYLPTLASCWTGPARNLISALTSVIPGGYKIRENSSTPPLWLTVAGILPSFIGAYLILKYLYHRRKSKPPPVVHLGNSTVPLHICLAKQRQKSGDIFYIQLNREKLLVLNSYDVIKEACSDRKTDFGDRTHEYAALRSSFNGLDLGFTDFGSEWIFMRKLSTRGLQNPLKHMPDLMQEEVAELLAKCVNTKDYSAVIADVHVNTMLHLLCGKRTEGIGMKVKDVLDFGALWLESTAPGFGSEQDSYPILRLLPFSDTHRKLRHLHKLQNEIIHPIIDCAVGTAGEHSVIRYFAENMNHSLGNSSSSTDALKGLTQTFLIAGIETVRSAFTHLVYLVAHHPRVQDVIHSELDTVVGRHLTPALAHKADLHFLNAAILETLRLVTVVPSVRRRTRTNTKVGGYQLPPRTQVLVNIWAAHHDVTDWDDPFVFLPERFLDDQGCLLSVDNPVRRRLIAFGMGQRVCVGAILAKQRLFLQASALLQKFHFGLSSECNCFPGYQDSSEKLKFDNLQEKESAIWKCDAIKLTLRK